MDDREFREQVQALDGAEVLNRLFALLDANYVNRWRNAQNTADREEAHRMLKAASDLKSEISFIANDSRISAFNRRS